MSSRFLAWCALLVLLVGGIAYESSAPQPCGGTCNVMFIVIDALSADHLATYGYDRDTRPETTAFFASRGIIFEHASSVAPWTFPSFPSMYYSNVPSSVSFSDLERGTDRQNIWSTSREAGVTVRGIHLLQGAGMFIYDGIYAPFLPSERGATPTLTSAPTQWHRLQMDLDLTKKTIDELEASSTRFITMTHIHSVHDPYEPDGAFAHLFESLAGPATIGSQDILALNAPSTTVPASTTELFRLRYDQGIAETDAMLGAFLNSLSTTTLANTAIIITADHGESFNEHGLFYHGVSLYESELHVPLFVYIPGARVQRIATPISTIDLAPTMLDLEGVGIPSSFVGKSLLPLIEGRSFGSGRVYPIQNGTPYFLDASAMRTHIVPPTLSAAGAATSSRAIIDVSEHGARLGAYKLFKASNAPTFELYNVLSDPQERVNLMRTVYFPYIFPIYLQLLAVYNAPMK